MKKFLVAVTSLLTIVGLAFSAAPANAYPIGQQLRLNLSTTSVVPGETVIADVTNAYPGCDVVFTSTLNKKIQQRITKTANAEGFAGYAYFNIAKAGVYTIAASYSCNYFAEKASSNVTSGNQTTTTITSFTASGTTFSVAGTLTFGGEVVPFLSGTAVFSDSKGTKLASTTVSTNASGVFSKSASVRKALLAGTYRVTVTFASSGAYLGSSATATTLRTTVIKLAKAKQYAPKIK